MCCYYFRSYDPPDPDIFNSVFERSVGDWGGGIYREEHVDVDHIEESRNFYRHAVI